VLWADVLAIKGGVWRLILKGEVAMQSTEREAYIDGLLSHVRPLSS